MRDLAKAMSPQGGRGKLWVSFRARSYCRSDRPRRPVSIVAGVIAMLAVNIERLLSLARVPEHCRQLLRAVRQQADVRTHRGEETALFDIMPDQLRIAAQYSGHVAGAFDSTNGVVDRLDDFG